MDSFLNAIQPHFRDWGYLIVVVVTFLENATFVGAIIPGDVVLLVAGFYAQRGTLDLPTVCVAAFAGGLAGDISGYAFGRWGGRFIADRFGAHLFLPKERVTRVERYFKRYGAAAVLLGRFAPMLRTVRTFVAGMSRMSFWRFLLADALGAALWAVLVPTLGFFFAGSLTVARRVLGTGGLIALVVLAVLFAVTYRRMSRRLAPDDETTAEDQS